MESSKFAALLKSKDITGYRVAKSTGIPQQTISRFITGETDMRRAEFQTAAKIAAALSITIDQLWKALQ